MPRPRVSYWFVRILSFTFVDPSFFVGYEKVLKIYIYKVKAPFFTGIKVSAARQGRVEQTDVK